MCVVVGAVLSWTWQRLSRSGGSSCISSTTLLKMVTECEGTKWYECRSAGSTRSVLLPDVWSRELVIKVLKEITGTMLRPSPRADTIRQWGNRSGDGGRVWAQTKVSNNWASDQEAKTEPRKKAKVCTKWTNYKAEDHKQGPQGRPWSQERKQKLRESQEAYIEGQNQQVRL